MKRKLLFVSFLLPLLFSCTNTLKLMKDKNAERLYFGNFGGFTNASVEYVLIDNAVIYKSIQNELTPVVRLSRQQARNIQQLVSAINLETIQLNEPGNMTYYIRIVRSGHENEIKWSASSENTDVKDLYNTLMSFLKQ